MLPNDNLPSFESDAFALAFDFPIMETAAADAAVDAAADAVVDAAAVVDAGAAAFEDAAAAVMLLMLFEDAADAAAAQAIDEGVSSNL